MAQHDEVHVLGRKVIMSSSHPSSFATFTQIVRVGGRSVVRVKTHVLPSGSHQPLSRETPYAWFNDTSNQALMVFVHELLMARATRNIQAEFEGAPPTNKDQFHFRKCPGLRCLLVFRTVTDHLHILMPNQQATIERPVCAAFISDHGKRVLPYLNTFTSGQGYRSYKTLSECLDVYVDCCEPTSSLGIFKVLRHLAPKHSVSLDIASYFRQTSDPGEQALSEIPMAGLQQRRSKRKTMAKPVRRSKVKKKSQIPVDQLLITDTIRTTACKDDDDLDVPKDVIDTLFDFDVTVCNEAAPVISGSCLGDIETESGFNEDTSEKRLSNKSVSIRACDEDVPCGYTGNSGCNSSNEEVPFSEQISPLDPEKENSPVVFCADPKLDSASQQSIDIDATPPIKDEPPNRKKMIRTKLSRKKGLLSLPAASDSVRSTRSKTLKHKRRLNRTSDVSKDLLLISDSVDRRASTPPLESPPPETAKQSPTLDQEECIDISSDDDNSKVVCTKSEVPTKQPLPLEDIIEGVRSVGDMTAIKILQWVKLRKKRIVKTFHGEYPSARHKDYSGTRKEKGSLKFRVDTSMFEEAAKDALHTALLNMFCKTNMKYFDYVMSVLVPESVVWLIADIHNLPYDEAEDAMYHYEKYEHSSDTSL